MSHVAVDGGRLLIGERLIEEGMITPEQLEEALQQQKRSGPITKKLAVKFG